MYLNIVNKPEKPSGEFIKVIIIIIIIIDDAMFLLDKLS